MIRKLTPADPVVISRAFADQMWNKPVDQYERYLAEFIDGQREVIVAEMNGLFAGYVSVLWNSSYAGFRDMHIPEIVDLNVLVRFRGRAIAGALIDEAEALIRERNEFAGIRVGLSGDYGPAQRLYVRRGYMPDGFGLSYRNEQCRFGDRVTVDDDLTLAFTKQLVGQ